MNTSLLGALVASALLSTAVSTTSFAQDRQRGFDGPRGERAGQMRAARRDGGMEMQPARFIERMDSDADGRVSASEFTDERLQRIDRLFERRDANGDGLISADEHEAPRNFRARRGERGLRGGRANRPQRLDIDREAVSACVREAIADYEPRLADEAVDVFADMDANGDGQLSLQEASASVTARAQGLFARMDASGDGYISEDEAAGHFAAQQDLRRTVQACVREQLQG